VFLSGDSLHRPWPTRANSFVPITAGASFPENDREREIWFKTGGTLGFLGHKYLQSYPEAVWQAANDMHQLLSFSFFDG
jgi:hypothetical protein